MPRPAGAYIPDHSFIVYRDYTINPKSTPSLISVTCSMGKVAERWVGAENEATKGLLIFLLQIEEKLRALREAKDEEDLMNKIRECAPDIANITQLATLRQNVRKHPNTGHHNTIVISGILCKEATLHCTGFHHGEIEPWYCFINLLDFHKEYVLLSSISPHNMSLCYT